jgi:hypothetical protein
MRHCKAARLTISCGTRQPKSADSASFCPAARAQQRMDNDTDPQNPMRRLMQWAITPPQSYGVYLVGLILVFVLSFYAGTLKPKHSPAPPATAPAAPRG